MQVSLNDGVCDMNPSLFKHFPQVFSDCPRILLYCDEASSLCSRRHPLWSARSWSTLHHSGCHVHLMMPQTLETGASNNFYNFLYPSFFFSCAWTIFFHESITTSLLFTISSSVTANSFVQGCETEEVSVKLETKLSQWDETLVLRFLEFAHCKNN